MISNLWLPVGDESDYRKIQFIHQTRKPLCNCLWTFMRTLDESDRSKTLVEANSEACPTMWSLFRVLGSGLRMSRLLDLEN